MGFTTYTFGIFFAIVLAVHGSPLPWRIRKLALLAASYVFLTSWRIDYLPVLLGSTLVDWLVVRAMVKEPLRRRKKWLFAVGVVAKLGPLAVFKYANFFVTSFAGEIARLLGIEWTPPVFHLMLPLGISFYTFQGLAYVIDVYRGSAAPARSLIDYALYIAFFPQLVSGPISRPGQLLPQLADVRPRIAEVGTGIVMILFGLWQKKVLSDAVMAPVVERVFSQIGKNSPFEAWAGILAFAHQVLFDFAGYSACAIGAALCLGVRLPVNFRFPFAARGFADFWQRWHISLSSWIRDYVYLPLSMSLTKRMRRRLPARAKRIGGQVGALIAIIVTMAVMGLWHGASWVMVVWGIAHGVLLVIEHTLKRVAGTSRIAATAPALVVYVLTTIAAFALLESMFRTHGEGATWSLWGEAFGQAEATWRGLELHRGSPNAWYLIVACVVMVLNVVISWRLRDVSTQQLIERMP